MYEHHLKCNFCKCFLVSVIVILMLPLCSAILHSAESYEEKQLVKARQVLAQRLVKCKHPEKRGVILYTLKRYNRLGPFNVTVCSGLGNTLGAAGVNAPWCPGITIDPEFFKHPTLLADILLHEALHDYPPYFGHTQHERLGS